MFTIPVACFEKQTALQYHVRVEMQPSYTNKKGETIVLLPGKKLGLPELYHHSWGGKKYRVFVYKTTKGVIWGITAELIHEIINIVQKSLKSWIGDGIIPYIVEILLIRTKSITILEDTRFSL